MNSLADIIRARLALSAGRLASDFRCASYEEFSQPPVRLEQGSWQLKSISQDYKLPQGITAHDLQKYAQSFIGDNILSSEKKLGLLDQMFEAVAENNPSLRQLQFDKTRDDKYIDALMGVASAYNVQDIQFYLRHGGGNEIERNIPGYRDIKRRLDFELGDHADWLPAPGTMQIIKEQLVQKKPDFGTKPIPADFQAVRHAVSSEKPDSGRLFMRVTFEYKK